MGGLTATQRTGALGAIHLGPPFSPEVPELPARLGRGGADSHEIWIEKCIICV